VTAGPEPTLSGVRVGDFDRVDDTGEADRFIEWLDAERRLRSGRGALGALTIRHSDRVLDVGCGPGGDLREIAERVGRDGFAVGIDLSAAMVQASSRRLCADGTQIACALADGQALPFAEGSFDACWIRAVLVHTPDPARAVSECARLLGPGGRLVVSEPDHGTHIVSTSEPEVFERIKSNRRRHLLHPLIGRELGGLLNEAGLVEIEVWATPLVYTSLATARSLGGPFDVAASDAVRDGDITQEEASTYLESLREQDERGAFFFGAISVSARGRKAQP
jgi:SAM-dependent methyltransferase